MSGYLRCHKDGLETFYSDPNIKYLPKAQGILKEF